MTTSRHRGTHYEKLAARFLRRQGLKLVESNYLCRLGEIDLIMRRGTLVVFVEVRFREHTGYGSAVCSVTPVKQRKILTTAKLYLCEKGLYDKVDCRFDVIGITLVAGRPEVEWIPAAFS